MSALEEFFASLAPEADLEQLIRDRISEDIHLEYKTKKDRSHPELDESDARQWSRALSGLANSDGGVLLWGVESDQHDRAYKLKPISGVDSFAGRLKRSLLNSTQPVVDGVQIELISSNEGIDQGYVKCFVPASTKTPHRAMLAGREYYKRSTEGFYRLEHFDLEDMFGRRPTARLHVRIAVQGRGSVGGGGDTTYTGIAVLSILNDGRGSALAPYLSFTIEPPYRLDRFGLDGNGYEGLPRFRTADHRRHVYGGSGGTPIHPGVLHDVAAIEVSVRVDHLGKASRPAPLRIRYEIAADHTALVSGAVELRPEEIARAVLPAGTTLP